MVSTEFILFEDGLSLPIRLSIVNEPFDLRWWFCCVLVKCRTLAVGNTGVGRVGTINGKGGGKIGNERFTIAEDADDGVELERNG